MLLCLNFPLCVCVCVQYGFAKTVSADHTEITKLPDHIGDSMEGVWALPKHSTAQKFVPIGALAGMSKVVPEYCLANPFCS